MESIVRVREALAGDREIVRYDVVDGLVDGALYTGAYADVTRVLDGLRVVERYKDADETYLYARNLELAEQLAVEGDRFDGIKDRTGLECMALLSGSRGEVKNLLWDKITEDVTLDDVEHAFYTVGEYRVVYSHIGVGTYRKLPGREHFGYVSMVSKDDWERVYWGDSGDMDPMIELLSGNRYYCLGILKLVEAIARHRNAYDQLDAYETEQMVKEQELYDALYELDADVLRVVYGELDNSLAKLDLYMYLEDVANK